MTNGPAMPSSASSAGADALLEAGLGVLQWQVRNTT